MKLSTRLVLAQSCMTTIPLANYTVEAMGTEQRHTRLKFTNKQDVELGDSDWTTGVDCDNTCQSNNQNNLDEDSDNDSNDKECTPEAERD